MDNRIEMAQTEIDRHNAEARRLFEITDKLVDTAEWHVKQAANWNGYLADIIGQHTAEVIPVQRHLTLVKE